MQAMVRSPRGLLHASQGGMMVRAGSHATGALARTSDTGKEVHRYRTSRAAISTPVSAVARHDVAVRQLTTGSRFTPSKLSLFRTCRRGCVQIRSAHTPRQAGQLSNCGVTVRMHGSNSSRLTSIPPAGMLRDGSFGEGTRQATKSPARRGMSSSNMSEREFHVLADEALEEIHDAVEEALEDGFEDEFDCNMSQGVLNILVGDRGTWVLNKQSPNRQIWWSSPISGPMRFEFHDDTKRWLNTRDGKTELRALLATEMSDKCGVSL